MSMKVASMGGSRRDEFAAVQRRDAQLAVRVSGAIERARRYVAIEPWAPSSTLGPLIGASGVLGDAVTALLDALRSDHQPEREDLVEICELAVELQRLQVKVQDEDVERRLIAIRAASQGGGLHAGETVEDRLRRAAVEMVNLCGFDRAVALRFHNGRMEMFATYFRGDEGWAAECHGYAVNHPAPLSPALLEWEMVRRQRPAMMLDPAHDPRAWRPFVHKYDTHSYTSSPVIVGGEGVAAIHGDMYYTGRDVDAFDRDVVGAYVARLTREIEQQVLIGRLHGQREAMSRLARETEAAVADLRVAELWHSSGDGGTAATPGLQPAGSPSALLGSPLAALTRREREVLERLSAGGTNAAIAEKLFVSEHTIKTHVENILRKLHAANRAEAVAQYLRAAAIPTGTPL
jgi:DNA-binding CsgD family transcriptional regulator